MIDIILFGSFMGYILIFILFSLIAWGFFGKGKIFSLIDFRLFSKIIFCFIMLKPERKLHQIEHKPLFPVKFERW